MAHIPRRLVHRRNPKFAQKTQFCVPCLPQKLNKVACWFGTSMYRATHVEMFLLYFSLPSVGWWADTVTALLPSCITVISYLSDNKSISTTIQATVVFCRLIIMWFLISGAPCWKAFHTCTTNYNTSLTSWFANHPWSFWSNNGKLLS